MKPSALTAPPASAEDDFEILDVNDRGESQRCQGDVDTIGKTNEDTIIAKGRETETDFTMPIPVFGL
jgi:hypothetical protein